jgi:hypothetical protein
MMILDSSKFQSHDTSRFKTLRARYHDFHTSLVSTRKFVKVRMDNFRHSKPMQKQLLGFRDGDVGLFRLLPLELLVCILKRLDFHDKVLCSTMICKSWRVLISCKLLWETIGPTISSAILWQIPKNIVRVFLLNANSRLISYETIKHNINILLLKNRNVKSISLSGSAITNKVAKHMMPLFNKNLQTLEIGNTNSSFTIHKIYNFINDDGSSFHLLQNATSLEHLILGMDGSVNFLDSITLRYLVKPMTNSLKSLTLNSNCFLCLIL